MLISDRIREENLIEKSEDRLIGNKPQFDREEDYKYMSALLAEETGEVLIFTNTEDSENWSHYEVASSKRQLPHLRFLDKNDRVE